MSRKRYKPEQVINLLREAEVGLSQGRKTGEICRSLGIPQQSYYRWRSEYGGMKLEQVKRLKELEKENARLKTSKFVEALPRFHHQGNCISFVAIRWHDFSNRSAHQHLDGQTLQGCAAVAASEQIGLRRATESSSHWCDLRHPAFRASSSEQNHRSPLLSSIRVGP